MARDDFLLSTPERRQLRRRRQRRWLIAAGVALLLVIVGFAARPARTAVRRWQARRNAERAFAALDKQKLGEARDAAIAAYRLAPQEPQALRAVSRLLSQIGQTDALEFWQSLEAVTPLTHQDLRDEARVALRVNDTPAARRAIERLLAFSDAGPPDWLLAAELKSRQQSLDDARRYAEKVLDDKRSTRRELLQATTINGNLAVTRHAAADVQKTDERLAALSNGTDDVSLDALLVLAKRALSAPAGEFHATRIEDLERAIDDHPLARAAQKLVATDLELAQHPDQRAEIIDRAVNRWKSGDKDALTALASWLYRNREYQRVVDTIPLERAQQTPELFLQYIDVLGALNRWDEIRKIIEDERFPLDPVVEQMYLARCFQQQHQQSGAENNWQRALEAAAGDVGKLMTLGEYAEKNGVLSTAAKAFDAAIASSPKFRSAYQSRLRVAYAQRDTKEIEKVLGAMLRIWPQDTAVQNDEAYMRLLLLPSISPPSSGGSAAASPAAPAASELKSIETLVQKLVQAEPDSFPHRTLLALVLLKEGRAADALAVYQNLNVTATALSPSALVVHAAVLAATGHYYDAGQELRQVQLDKLLPEERVLAAWADAPGLSR